MIKCKIALEIKDPKNVLMAIDPENRGYVECRVENNRLVCEWESKNINSFMRTFDDLITSIILSNNLL